MIASAASSRRGRDWMTPVTLEELAAELACRANACARSRSARFEKVQKAVKNRVAAMETPKQPEALPAH